ncbi:hypothetical protein BGZ54_006483 [Gamsiella multidivaricata]|nr:hypothetical protein BGZ54_006483 [Gamsiella multidivaricata]
MSKLFASSSPFSQTNYSPLRNTQEHSQGDDDPDTSNTSSGNSGHPSPLSNRQHYHSPQQNVNYRHFRHRSQSQSSIRSILSMPDQPSLPTVFAEGEDESGADSPIQHHHQQRFSHKRTSLGIVAASPSGATTTASATVIDRSTWRISANIRPQSVSGGNATAMVAVETSSPLLRGGDYAEKELSHPPKYTAEDMEYSEPERRSFGRDEEEAGTGYYGGEDGQGDGLLMQASTTLVLAVAGLICAGWLLDVIQHWPVFENISELIILIPILLNLKGNLEMNLASRLSTAANMGLLDQRVSRNAFIKGNLALLQLQSLAVGSVAGLFSFGLGMIVHSTTNNFSEIALMITASMVCAAMSSFVLGGFMCGLVLVCRQYKINPDTALPAIMLAILLALIPAWIVYVRRNKYVAEVAKEGWSPVFAAMVIASTAGLTLEQYIDDYPGMALVSPVLNGLTGNIGSIYASRISTSLHVNIKENYRETEKTLFLVHIPIQILFLVIIGVLGLGHMHWSGALVLGYSIVALSLVVISLAMARWITHLFWRWGYDPDNYALPILTSLIDVIGTVFLVAGFWALHYGNYDA